MGSTNLLEKCKLTLPQGPPTFPVYQGQPFSYPGLNFLSFSYMGLDSIFRRNSSSAALSLGLSKAVATRTFNKAALFVDHLVSRLHSVHKTRERAFTTLEIRDALNPYLETLFEEFGGTLVDLVENFPNSPIEEISTGPSVPPVEGQVVPVSAPITSLNSKKLRAFARLTDSPTGKLPPEIIYLAELGIELEVIPRFNYRFVIASGPKARAVPDYGVDHIQNVFFHTPSIFATFLINLSSSQTSLSTHFSKYDTFSSPCFAAASRFSRHLVSEQNYHPTYPVSKSAPTPQKTRHPLLQNANPESGNAGSQNLRVAPGNWLESEKEEAKALLTFFLKEQGFSKAVAGRTINKSALFIDHLVSKLHSVHKTRYLSGQELSTLEIRDALNPYLETLFEEFGEILVDVIENFPNPPVEERSIENLPPGEEGPVVPFSAPVTSLNSKKLRALATSTDDGPTEEVPPQIIYLTKLGMDVEVIEEVTRKFPPFADYTVDENIKPVVEFLLDLGVTKSDIPAILRKRPQLCGLSLSKKLIPTVTFLENLGVDKKQWSKVICRFPALLVCSRHKLKSNLDCLYELGLSTKNRGKVLMRFPPILGVGVEKLRDTAEYFHSIGVDVGTLLHKCPQIFGLSIEANLKPVTEFFLERGFSIEEIAFMVSRFGNFYTLSLSNNIMPKWEFFLTTGYAKSDLVKYPQYFGHSLEERIKPRTQLTFPKKLFFCLAKLVASSKPGSHNFGVTPANSLLADKEEAKAVLTLFLKKRGFNEVIAARTMHKSVLFVDHLVSRLHAVHKTQHPGGRELTTREIRDALYAYLETLYEEFGDILVDVVENFPNPPTEERSIENLSVSTVEGGPVSAPITSLNSQKLRALARLTDDGPTGKLPPLIIYLTELGMEHEVIKKVISKFPPFADYSLDEKVKPVVEFLLDLGVPKSDIPAILRKWPQLCGVSLSEQAMHSVTFLENLGVDKKQWAKVIYRFPGILSCTRLKLKSNLDCLYELGLSTEKQGKVLMRCPNILGYGVERLRATAKYFHSIGVDVGTLLHKCPHIFSLSIEANLKPVTEFFLERGFSIEEVAFMASRFGNFYTLSLSKNIMPKWEFFLTMGYPKSDLVRYPQYFGCSLELRIKPRTQLTFPSKLFFCRAKYAELRNAGSHNLISAPANPLLAEKEEAKAVLTLFLKKHCLSKVVATRTVDKSALFIDHLVSRLHSGHKNRYLGGSRQELTTLEIGDALNPYLETLYEEFGDSLVDVVENFPNPATEVRSTENLSIPSLEEEPVVPVSASITTLDSKKLKALARLTDDGLTGKPPPHIVYLTELGMDTEVIKEVTQKFPKFAYYSLDRNVKPFVECLLDLGIPISDIPTILRKRPQLCGVHQTENLIRTMTYLKNLGMDKKQLTKAIRRFPALVTYSRQKLESTIDLLYELGLPAEKLGKVLMRGPQIIGLSAETLKARAKYFHSIGVDVGSLLYRHPQIFCLNIETKLKPSTEFFLERGFSTADIASMISKFGSLYNLSLSNNILPKWEYFLTMCYPKSDLVKFPQYFGYSLELRIKPRTQLTFPNKLFFCRAKYGERFFLFNSSPCCMYNYLLLYLQ
ncbi:hypothetical protein RHMOL_Rhmol08G0053500 [Rhododendron molle]|uniref:Uncharacterized protein n=1 Tax=Rhododendron molle TaxID=49168 RepID=A0ACC0MLY2_RHOML|nr:hypothetical protein RHMOL_Rhmol08G0053500 [Rhododendron molle]